MDQWFNEIFEKGMEHGVPYIVVAVFTVLSGLFGAWFKSRVDANTVARNEDRKDFVTIIAERKAEREAQAAEIRELKAQIGTMQSRISSLEGRVAQRPFAEWSLSFNGIYTWGNLEMANRFLKGRSPDWIIGKTHRDIWPTGLVHLFERLDAEVRGSSPHLTVITNVTLDPGELPYIIIKYGQADANTGAVINFYGMAIPMVAMNHDNAPAGEGGYPPSQLIAPLN